MLSTTADLILAAMRRYHYLTNLQVCRLFFSSGSIKYVTTITKTMADSGLLQRLERKKIGHGSFPLVYTLGTAGYKRLHALGYNGIRYRPSEEAGKYTLFMDHTLAVNDVMIAGELMARVTPGIRLEQVLHERDFRKEPMLVSGKRLACDGWLDFHLAGQERECLLLEVDRATEDAKVWKAKVGLLVEAMQGAYKAKFATDWLTVLVWSSDCGRIETLLRWTQTQLEGRHQNAGDVFRFSCSDPVADPVAFFFAATARKPFSQKLVPIIAPL